MSKPQRVPERRRSPATRTRRVDLDDEAPFEGLMEELGLPADARFAFEAALLEGAPKWAVESLFEDLVREELDVPEVTEDFRPRLPALNLLALPKEGTSLGLQQSTLLHYSNSDPSEVYKDGLRAFTLSFLGQALAALFYRHVLEFITAWSHRIGSDVPQIYQIIIPLENEDDDPQKSLGDYSMKLRIINTPAGSPYPCVAIVTEYPTPPRSTDVRRISVSIDGSPIFLDIIGWIPKRIYDRRKITITTNNINIKMRQENHTRSGANKALQVERGIILRYVSLLYKMLRWAFKQTIHDAPWWRLPLGIVHVPSWDPYDQNARDEMADALRDFLTALQVAMVPEKDASKYVACIMMPDVSKSTLHPVVYTEGFPTIRFPITLFDAHGPRKAAWGLSGRAFMLRQQLISRDAQHDPRVLDAELERVKQAMAVPVVMGGQVILQPPSEDEDLPRARHTSRVPASGVGDHYHDYAVIYLGLTDAVGEKNEFQPEQVIFAHHIGTVLAELLAYVDIRGKRNVVFESAMKISYRNLIHWIDADYFLDNGEFMKRVSRFVGNKRKFPANGDDRDGKDRRGLSFVLVSIDQKETLFRDLGGSDAIAVAYMGLRKNIDRVLGDTYAWVMCDYQHDVLVAIENCGLREAWEVADEIREIQNLSGMLPLVGVNQEFRGLAITVSCMIWSATCDRLVTMGLGDPSDGRAALDMVLRKLKSEYRRRREQIGKENEDQPYPAVGEIFWYDHAGREVHSGEQPPPQQGPKLLPYSVGLVDAEGADS